MVAPVARDDVERLVLQILPGHGVERAERLVHHQGRRVLREAAGDLQALLHAARHLARIFVGWPLRPTRVEQFGDAERALAARHAHRLQRQRYVAFRGAPRQQRLRVILKHDGDVAARAFHRGAVEARLARVGAIRPGGDAQRRRLAAAAGADEAEDLAAREGRTRAAEHELIAVSQTRR